MPSDLASSLQSVDLTQLVTIVTAIGALGTASFALVDASKAFGGSVSNRGLSILYTAAGRFAPALRQALGQKEDDAWKGVIRAHWINGRPRDEQKAIVKSLIRLGLTPETASALALATSTNAEALTSVADKLDRGEALLDTELNLLGRLDASVDAQLDAAFDHADQAYRNICRLVAGFVSLALALLAEYALENGICTNIQWPRVALVGLLAVPLAPMAKDLASSLQAAASALRSTKR